MRSQDAAAAAQASWLEMSEVSQRIILKPAGFTPEQASRLAQELAAAVDLQNKLAETSPYVLRFISDVQETERAFIVEHEPARPLPIEHLLDPNAASADPKALLRITSAIFDTLQVAHGTVDPRPVVHGGLCPGVLLTSPGGIEKVTDFGFAAAIYAALGAESYLNLAVGPGKRGSPEERATGVWEVLDRQVVDRADRLCSFIDPEKYAGRMYQGFEPPSDIIAAGFILHLLAEHRHPYFEDDPDAHRIVEVAEYMAMGTATRARRADLRESSEPAVRAWCELVSRMIERFPQNRPTAGDVLTGLKQAGLVIEPPKPEVITKKRAAVVVAAVALIVVIGAIGYGVSRPSPKRPVPVPAEPVFAQDEHPDGQTLANGQGATPVENTKPPVAPVKPATQPNTGANAESPATSPPSVRSIFFDRKWVNSAGSTTCTVVFSEAVTTPENGIVAAPRLPSVGKPAPVGRAVSSNGESLAQTWTTVISNCEGSGPLSVRIRRGSVRNAAGIANAADSDEATLIVDNTPPEPGAIALVMSGEKSLWPASQPATTLLPVTNRPVRIAYAGAKDAEGGSGLKGVELRSRRKGDKDWKVLPEREWDFGEKAAQAGGVNANPDGEFEFSLRATDNAGNSGESVPISILYDKTRPDVTDVKVQPGPGSEKGRIDLIITAVDPVPASEVEAVWVEVPRDSAEARSVEKAGGQWTAQLTVAEGLKSDKLSAVVYARDRAGNVSDRKSVDVPVQNDRRALEDWLLALADETGTKLSEAPPRTAVPVRSETAAGILREVSRLKWTGKWSASDSLPVAALQDRTAKLKTELANRIDKTPKIAPTRFIEYFWGSTRLHAILWFGDEARPRAWYVRLADEKPASAPTPVPKLSDVKGAIEKATQDGNLSESRQAAGLSLGDVILGPIVGTAGFFTSQDGSIGVAAAPDGPLVWLPLPYLPFPPTGISLEKVALPLGKYSLNPSEQVPTTRPPSLNQLADLCARECFGTPTAIWTLVSLGSPPASLSSDDRTADKRWGLSGMRDEDKPLAPCLQVRVLTLNTERAYEGRSGSAANPPTDNETAQWSLPTDAGFWAGRLRRIDDADGQPWAILVSSPVE